MPLALPTIFAGVNQTIMMALAMVVIASMIGVKGLRASSLKSYFESIPCFRTYEWLSNCSSSYNI